MLPASPADAHRRLGPEHDLAASLSSVETRQVANDYTFRCALKTYQIARADIRAGLRGGTLRVEQRIDGTLAVRFQNRYLQFSECQPQPKPVTVKATPSKRRKAFPGPSPAYRQSMQGIAKSGGMPAWKAAQFH